MTCECPRVELSTICEHICSEVGLDADMYDFSALTQCVLGYTRSNRMTGRAALEPLQAAFGFDLVEVDGKITAVPRDGSADTGLTLDADDIGAVLGNADTEPELVVVRAQDAEIPREVRVSYMDVGLDYQPGLQRQLNPVAPTANVMALETPIVFTATEAKQVAARLLQSACYDRVSCEVAVRPAHVQLVPTDIVLIDSGNATYRVRLERMDVAGPGLIKANGSLDLAAAYEVDEIVAETREYTPQTIVPPGVTIALPLDIPILRDADNDPGMYAVAWGPADGWRGASLYRTPSEDAWTSVAGWTSGHEGTVGRITAGLPSVAHPWAWDEVNAVEVTLINGAGFSSVTDAALLTGSNAALVGSPGRWELIQFGSADEDSGTGVWTLTHLLRGRRGTEWAIGTGQANDWFILLDAIGIRRVYDAANAIGMVQSYRAVSFGSTFDESPEWQFTNYAVGLKPFAPVGIEGARDGATGDLTITWHRRSRIGGEWIDGADVPLGEALESYSLDLYEGTALLRTLSATSESATYALADYNADTGGAASEIPALEVAVYQISNTVGRGYPGEATL